MLWYRPSPLAWFAPLIVALVAAAYGCPEEPPAEERPTENPEEPADLPVLAPPAPRADAGEGAIQYTITIDEPATHLMEVRGLIPTGGAESVELFMATWTPGSYLIREYARHVEGFQAISSEGEALAWDKVSKNRWRVTTGGQEQIAIRYLVYCSELSVRTNFVDADLASINGAPTFIAPVGFEGDFDLALTLPPEWTVVTALPARDASPSGAPRFQAEDFDQLLDSPIVAGSPILYEFEAGGVPHVLANLGESPLWDGERSARDVATITEVQQRFWGVIPYAKYWYLNLLVEGRGGLEHKASTLMLTSTFAMADEESYLDWLGLVSHEFFHTWNVKRMRPEALGPFDYENERYTESLWIAEGLTSYYDDLLLHRAALMDQEAYLKRLSDQIASVETTPGRLVQPLSRASFDAWIKYYRPDENSINTAISYYRKGAVVGFLLDAEIRRRNRGERSLDDVMRAAYERFSGEDGYSEQEWRTLASEVAGFDLTPFFDATVDGTGPLAYDDALDYYGLTFPVRSDDAEAASDSDSAPAPYLGVQLDEDGGQTRVEAVLRGTPAYDAGLNAGDEVIAVNGYRVRSGGLANHLKAYEIGDEVTLLLARRGRMRELPVTLGASPSEDAWRLAPVEPPTAVQQSALRAWLEPAEQTDTRM